ncbi:MAG: hypothetical protein ACQEVT_18915, partial [Pseudomonadota bacterium]
RSAAQWQNSRHRSMTQKKKTQIDKFKEAARQLETDDDDERFEKKLKKLVKQKRKNNNEDDQE